MAVKRLGIKGTGRRELGDFSRLVLAAAILALILGAGKTDKTRAQSGLEGWFQPVNLSQSGAATQPRIIASPEGQFQVYWLDSFDGLTTTFFDGETWSPPAPAPFPVDDDDRRRRANSPADSGTVLTAPPYLIGDGTGWVHAFWVEGSPSGTLLHSQMMIGGSGWSFPETLDDSTLAFSVSVAPQGGLSLAFVRTLHTDEVPAGVYYARITADSEDRIWPRPIYSSIYFRLITSWEAALSVAEGGDGRVFLILSDPRLGTTLTAHSLDGGKEWSEPETLVGDGENPVAPGVFAFSDGSAVRSWQASSQGECALQIQRLSSSGEEPAAPIWDQPERIVLEGEAECPQADRFIPGEISFWLWGEGSNNLHLSSWDRASMRWLPPREFSFTFQDTAVQRLVGLSDLHAAVTSDRMAVVGADTVAGEIWVTFSRENVFDLAQSPPPSLWIEPIALSEPGLEPGQPTLAVDRDGLTHVIWSQFPSATSSIPALFYARWNGQTLTGPARIINAAQGEIARHPAILPDESGQLHLVWSGGLGGEILYSRAETSEASSANSWPTPKTLSNAGAASSPQIGMDSFGRIYILYTVPLNENRGLFILKSDDGGETWDPPAAVFDAVAAGWQMISDPTLAVAADGVLHAAWVEDSLPDTWPPKGIFYSRSPDGGETWSEPVAVAGEGFHGPRLALAAGQIHLLFANRRAGGVWHRWASDGGDLETGLTWSTATQVPGWQGVNAPLGVTVDGLHWAQADDAPGTLHLVGSDAGLNTPLYSTWNGSNWSSLEFFAPLSEAQPGLGAAAATRPQGGTLSVAWLRFSAAEARLPVLNFISRSIPAIEVTLPPAPETLPTPTPLPSPAPTDAPPVTPTPELNRDSPPVGPTVPPLALGGGLAALIMVGAIVTRLMWTRHR